MKSTAIAYLKKNDPVLSKIIQTLSVPEFQSTKNVFHDLMSCIVEQQIHYRSTKKTFQKLLDKAEIKILNLENFEQFEEKGLATTKLSTRKYETIVNTIDYFSNNQTNWNQLSEEIIRTQLSTIKGIGTWTIDILLLYTFNQADVFPADDYHLKNIMTKLYTLNPTAKLKQQMLDIAEKWSPHQSTAVLYLLAWKEYEKAAKTK